MWRIHDYPSRALQFCVRFSVAGTAEGYQILRRIITRLRPRAAMVDRQSMSRAAFLAPMAIALKNLQPQPNPRLRRKPTSAFVGVGPVTPLHFGVAGARTGLPLPNQRRHNLKRFTANLAVQSHALLRVPGAGGGAKALVFVIDTGNRNRFPAGFAESFDVPGGIATGSRTILPARRTTAIGVGQLEHERRTTLLTNTRLHSNRPPRPVRNSHCVCPSHSSGLSILIIPYNRRNTPLTRSARSVVWQ